MKLLVFFLTILLSVEVKAQWICSHPMLCKLAEDYFSITSQEKPQLNKAVAAVGDPHHIEPTSNEIKLMTKADVLLLAPIELHPWSRSVIKLRGNKRSLEFITPASAFENFKGASRESLAHFWLYPTIHCSYWEQFHNWLNANEKELPKCPYLEIMENLKLNASKIKEPMIISHDALVPLLNSLGIKAYAIRGSGHHEEPHAAQLKQLQKLLDKNPKVIWVIESRINFPGALKSMQRTSDITINVDTNGDYPFIGLTPLQRLQLMLAKL